MFGNGWLSIRMSSTGTYILDWMICDQLIKCIYILDDIIQLIMMVFSLLTLSDRVTDIVDIP